MTENPKTYQSPKGTHDILPEQIPSWRFVEETFRAVCARYNYGEIRTPVYEHAELFDYTAGESSDVLVTKQTFTVFPSALTDEWELVPQAPDPQRPGVRTYGRERYTLRAEGTAPAVRAYLEHHLNERGPVCKLFYIVPIFRYEAPQAGRYRQHHQCGIELLGAAGPEADAEVLALAADFLRALGIEVALHLNSLGTLHSRADYLKVLRAYLEPQRENLSPDSQKRLDVNPLRIFDSKDERDRAILTGAPRLLEHLEANDADSMGHFRRLCGYLDALGITYEIDHELVRGFDYYSRTAFEFISDKLGAQSTVLGGGRYDGLVEALGGEPTPGIGFGAGIERLLLVREASGAPTPPEPLLTAFLVTMGDAARAAGVGILRQLRDAGIRCDCDFVGRSVKAQMREANRQAARYTLLLGDNELAQNAVMVKDMATGIQEPMPLEAAIAKLEAIDADAAVARYFAQGG